MIPRSKNSDIIRRIANLIFEKSNTLGVMGGLLQLFNSTNKIKWPFHIKDLSNLSLNTKTGLREKSWLLSILKVVSNLMIFNFQWKENYQ